VQLKQAACQFVSYSRWLDETWPTPEGTASALPPNAAAHCVRLVFILWWLYDDFRRITIPINNVALYRDWINMRKCIGDIICYVWVLAAGYRLSTCLNRCASVADICYQQLVLFGLLFCCW
jgi:hypothetical protein